jgi:hypothetical protein
VISTKNSEGGHALCASILHRKPQTIASIIKKIERYVPYTSRDKSVFTDRPDNMMFYFGLAYELTKLGVEDSEY